jgi:hypothetical protein
VIDAVIWMGVTGHRPAGLADADETALRARVRAVIDGLGQGSRLGLISPLAEGADRLVAEEVLRAGGLLRCLFPFDVALYRQDFDGPGSTAAFEALAARAIETRTLASDVSTPELRTAAYEAVGQAVVDRASVVLAIWDGEPAQGRGGTGEIVDFALDHGVPTVWIEAAAPHVAHYRVSRAGVWVEVHPADFFAAVQERDRR